MLMLAARSNRRMDKDLAFLHLFTRHTFRSQTMENGCKLRRSAEENTDVFELARFAYPVRREIYFLMMIWA